MLKRVQVVGTTRDCAGDDGTEDMVGGGTDVHGEVTAALGHGFTPVSAILVHHSE